MARPYRCDTHFDLLSVLCTTITCPIRFRFIFLWKKMVQVQRWHWNFCLCMQICVWIVCLKSGSWFMKESVPFISWPYDWNFSIGCSNWTSNLVEAIWIPLCVHIYLHSVWKLLTSSFFSLPSLLPFLFLISSLSLYHTHDAHICNACDNISKLFVVIPTTVLNCLALISAFWSFVEWATPVFFPSKHTINTSKWIAGIAKHCFIQRHMNYTFHKIGIINSDYIIYFYFSFILMIECRCASIFQALTRLNLFPVARIEGVGESERKRLGLYPFYIVIDVMKNDEL